MKGIDIDKPLQEARVKEITPLPLKQSSSSTFWQLDIDKQLQEAKPFPLKQCSSSAFRQHLLVTEKEDSIKNSTVGLREYDVIFGKGKVAHAHHGNKQFRRIVQKYREEYQNTKARDVKKRITNNVIDAVRQLGGRFLKLNDVDDDDSLFEEAAFECQYLKVSHALRSSKAPKTSSTRKRSPSPCVETTPVLSAPLPMESQQVSLDLYGLLL